MISSRTVARAGVSVSVADISRELRRRLGVVRPEGCGVVGVVEMGEWGCGARDLRK